MLHITLNRTTFSLFQLTYDLVTMCHTLLELPSAEARLTAVDNLWRKTNGYLVIVESGTNAAFQVEMNLYNYPYDISIVLNT